MRYQTLTTDEARQLPCQSARVIKHLEESGFTIPNSGIWPLTEEETGFTLMAVARPWTVKTGTSEEINAITREIISNIIQRTNDTVTQMFRQYKLEGHGTFDTEVIWPLTSQERQPYEQIMHWTANVKLFSKCYNIIEDVLGEHWHAIHEGLPSPFQEIRQEQAAPSLMHFGVLKPSPLGTRFEFTEAESNRKNHLSPTCACLWIPEERSFLFINWTPSENASKTEIHATRISLAILNTLTSERMRLVETVSGGYFCKADHRNVPDLFRHDDTWHHATSATHHLTYQHDHATALCWERPQTPSLLPPRIFHCPSPEKGWKDTLHWRK